MALYSIAVLGKPTKAQRKILERQIITATSRFRLDADDIDLVFDPELFEPSSRSSAAAIFFGGRGSVSIDISQTLDVRTIPVLPVASRQEAVGKEIPDGLRGLNCVFYEGPGGSERVFAALLECLGMLPRQRRVFLSYKRDESSALALQLFAELSARQYEVFLDTHSISTGVDFQESLWHSLCDVDVMLMLDSPNYFESRWTSAEYGRALAKGIGVLRVQWPEAQPSSVTGTSSLIQLAVADFNAAGSLQADALDAVCDKLEDFRSLAHATRHFSIVGAVEDAVAKIRGHVEGMDGYRAMQIRLRSGKRLVIQPTVGIPTAVTLQQALERAGNIESAIVYDHVGIKPSWLAHMGWLGSSVKGARWIKATEAAWDLAGWEAR
ncbi:toll/interleukin-1 receptor domain-containing protein [Achromobacter mucicolens]|uniref:toll/interleukin-1 receptor domain-containing protein n=1 Tax=Achromobacter mucicolens TaxID=1389922 RepID=UPI001CC051C7|nr:toll/interleukin-1 receptor domain-containing protein [Achromobacter mucicolens]UAN02012.1 toll/interleukin-1 receptor domain-containing protein [Achromobacter mucicolens]